MTDTDTLLARITALKERLGEPDRSRYEDQDMYYFAMDAVADRCSEAVPALLDALRVAVVYARRTDCRCIIAGQPPSCPKCFTLARIAALIAEVEK